MSKRYRKSKKRVKSLMWMIVLTGMLMIFSTYAWFSTNRTVQLNNMTAKVTAAEGLQISVDGETWVSSIDLSPVKDADGKVTTYVPKALSDVGSTVNNYVWPEELHPVSTDGTTVSGDTDFKFYAGEISADGSTLSSVKNDTTIESYYISFDLYFKNSSSKVAGDILKWGTTTLSVKQTGYGLEGSARMGILLYENTADFNDAVSDIRTLEPGVPSAAIFEPFCATHTASVLKFDDRITEKSVTGDTYSSTETVTTAFSTLAIKRGAPTGGSLTGVNAAEIIATGDGANSGFLKEQETMKSINGVIGSTEGVEIVKLGTLGADKLTLAQNKIMKARIYVWLEGQDPDCVDAASQGTEIYLSAAFTKDGNN